MLKLEKILGLSFVLGNVLLVNGFLVNGAQNDPQCSGLPLLCPQWCMRTDAKGCTVCDTNCHSYNGGAGPQTAGGLSVVNPNSMLSFNPALSSQIGGPGNLQIGSQNQGQGSGYPNMFNPSNSGPQNPFLNGASVNQPGNPAGVINPSNTALSINAGLGANPSNPGGGPVVNLGGLPSGNQNQINPSGGQTGSGILIINNGMNTGNTAKPIIPGTNIPKTTVQASTKPPIITTTITATTTASQVAATCAPVRCVAPCDKGITLDAAGCPVCLCS